MIPLITLEEHFFAKAIGESPSYKEQFKWIPGLLDKLEDLDDLRIKEMKKGEVTLQVISHGPGLGSRELPSGVILDKDPAKPDTPGPVTQCILANNQLYEAIKRNRERYAGFATLPMAYPEDAAGELRRCVKELGFVGALVDNHSDGHHFDGSAYRAFWQAVQDLDVPIYLHPTWPDSSIEGRFTGDLISDGAAMSMGASGFGWHIDTGLHVLKLFASGLFDELPRLKVVIGHMGETLPFMLERICKLSQRWGDRSRDFQQVWDDNIWITTSGCWSVNPMATILRNTKIEHILYSVDYPFEKNEVGLKFMEELKESGLVTDGQLEMIGYRNAEKLLGVKVT